MSTTAGEKPAAAGLVDSIQDMALALAEMRGEIKKQADTAMLMADVRDVITEATGVTHSQLCDVLLALQDLQHPAAPPPAAARRWPWLPWAGGALAGLALCAALWWLWPAHPYVSLAIDLDRILAHQVGQLPKPVQEQLKGVYARHGIVDPTQRQKGN